jgi:hypothetical protein
LENLDPFSFHKTCYSFLWSSIIFSHLCSSIMLFSGDRPTQALRMFSNMALCLASAFTTGVPGGTCFNQKLIVVSNITLHKPMQTLFMHDQNVCCNRSCEPHSYKIMVPWIYLADRDHITEEYFNKYVKRTYKRSFAEVAQDSSHRM